MKTPKFGFRLPNVRGYKSFDYIVELSHEGERLGFDSVWVSDHLLYPESYATMIGSRFFFEPLTTLSCISSTTRKITLGTSVLLPLRNPILTASMGATLDHASKGRLIMGFGVGWYRPEFDALGVSFEKRGRVEDEEIQLILDLWTKSKITFEGTFFKVSDLAFDAKPYQKPHPRILIGGSPQYAKKRIARFGGGWLPISSSLSKFKEGMAMIKEACEEAGRSHEDLLFAADLPACIYRNEVTRREVEFLCLWQKKSERELKDVGIIGNPREAAERLRGYIDAGVEHVTFSFAPFGREKEMLRIISEEVIPNVS